jgi:membrane peptidoglycan carboxypeptidase
MGVTNLAKMNTAFAHTVTQNGVPLRTLWVGPENPLYTPLQQIPMSMQQAIMTGEDGDFYHHQGFYPEAFRRSIAQNYRKGKFARGGSTITMQLVKNVFLNPRKTIARKAEELLITWIIENQRITSKARMIEVYLNVIEFGSNVWGIGEASRHYFGKHPSALEPIESVFLAGLVPRPRVFQNLLEPDGSVSSKNGNFIAIRNRFVRRGLLPQEDSNRVHVGLLRSVYRHLQPMDSATLAKELLEEDLEDY